VQIIPTPDATGKRVFHADFELKFPKKWYFVVLLPGFQKGRDIKARKRAGSNLRRTRVNKMFSHKF
jgi:hypothetical protein